MKLSFAIIAKNEANSIEKCLKSLKGADEIVIVDTGSEDNTVEIAKRYTDKVFTDYKWNDNFAEARNHANSKCSGDWIFVLDCDNQLDTPINEIKDRIAEVEKLGGRTISVKCVSQSGGEIHYLPLLYKNSPDIYWKGAAHNHLSEDDRYVSDIIISYWHSDSHFKDKDRTFRILKKEIEKNPNLSREKFYLAREYLYRKDYKNAIKWYNDYLVGSHFDGEKAEACLQLAKCYWNTQKGDLARSVCVQAIGFNANFKEAIEFMAEICGPVNRGRWLWFAQTATNESVLFIRTKQEKKSNYYDDYYKTKPDLSRYDAIYQEIGKIVKDKSILDIGCGPADTFKYVKNYQGFDFSEEAVKLAKEKTNKVWVGSAYDKENFKKADYYVATEILEHTDDYRIIANVPKRKGFIFTVPSFSDPAHLRAYSEQIIRERYRDILDIKNIIIFNWHNQKWEKGGDRTTDCVYLVISTKK